MTGVTRDEGGASTPRTQRQVQAILDRRRWAHGLAVGMLFIATTGTVRAQVAPAPDRPPAVPPPEAAARASMAVPTRALTESELLARWLREGRELEAIRSEIGAARFDVVQAAVLPNPQLGFATSFLLEGVAPDGAVNFGPDLSWEIPLFGQVGARENAASQALREVELEVAARLWEQAAEIREAVVERAFTAARITLLEQRYQEILDLLRIAEARTQLGADRPYDGLRIQVLAQTILAGLGDARADLAEAEGRVLALVAVPGLDQVPVTPDGLRRHPQITDSADLVERALSRRPDLIALRQGIRTRSAEAERYRIEALPSPVLSLGAWFTFDQSSSNLLFAVSVPIPLFDRNQGRIGRALAEADGLRAAAEALELRVRHEVESALARHRLAAEALARFRVGPLATASLLVDRAKSAYQEGAFGIVELLDAHEAAWQARAQELELEREVAEAEGALLRVSGAPQVREGSGG